MREKGIFSFFTNAACSFFVADCGAMRLARSGCILLLLASGSLSFDVSFSVPFSLSRVAEDEVDEGFLAATAGTGRDATLSFLTGFGFFVSGAGEGEEGLRPELELSFSASLSLELSLELESEELELELAEDADDAFFFLPFAFAELLSLELLSELESLLLLLLLLLLPFFESLAFFTGRSSSLLSSEEDDEESLSLESELLESDEDEARLRFCPALTEGFELESELESESLLLSSLESFSSGDAPPSASLLLSSDSPLPLLSPLGLGTALLAQRFNNSFPSLDARASNGTPLF